MYARLTAIYTTFVPISRLVPSLLSLLQPKYPNGTLSTTWVTAHFTEPCSKSIPKDYQIACPSDNPRAAMGPQHPSLSPVGPDMNLVRQLAQVIRVAFRLFVNLAMNLLYRILADGRGGAILPIRATQKRKRKR